MSHAQPTTRTLTFGSFRLLAAERGLFKKRSPRSPGSRALLILIALVERAGELFTKEELWRALGRTDRSTQGDFG
jgi:DNA-binding winged helix-turn-helix (wHTH) protein